ncbi:MAG: DUF4153 domain-containing protein [Prevotellaceae bacterium]|jgi:hypothetical protein|nr:DUF4153 domain-containing protein [Prevotellaceae bacterium]
MKKINWSLILARMKEIVLRFPVATLCCVALFIIEILIIDGNHLDSQDDFSFKLNLLLPLGFISAVALRLFTEDLNRQDWRSYADLLVIPPLALYYSLLPGPRDFSSVDLTYYVVLCLVSITGVCVAPYRSLSKPSLFWKYIIGIGWRYLFSVICAGVFLAGLCLALLTIDTLFNVPIKEEWYLYLICFVGILFAPLFFTAGIPVLSQFVGKQDKNYTILRVFGQYILLPVLALYLLIFYAYGLKILVTWQLPDGMVGWMTICYSAAGLLVYFLLHHFYLTKATKIATLFGRYFFYSELPVLALLFVAAFRRTADYGITENRYFLWAGAFWLLGISLYMIFTKGKTFRPILVSLSCAAVLSVVGPWNVFNVSEYSQMHRLKKLLAKQEYPKEGKPLDEGQIHQAQVDYRQIQGIIKYFDKKEKPLPSGIDSLCKAYEERYETCRMEYREEEEVAKYTYFEIETKEAQPFEITGYDRMYYFRYWSSDANQETLSAEDATLAVKIKARPNDAIEIYHYGVLSTSISLPDAVRQIAGISWKDISYYDMVADKQRITIDSKYAVIFTEINGYLDKQSLNIQSARMYILEKNK